MMYSEIFTFFSRYSFFADKLKGLGRGPKLIHKGFMQIKRLITCLLLLLITLPLSMAYSAPAVASEPVKIQLRWTHQFQFAGYYAAIEKGFYKEEGLDVELIEFDPVKGRVEPVLNGSADYGVLDASLLVNRLAGEPVVLLAQIFQHSPLVLVTTEESGIYSPFDLAGKTVMYNPEDLPIRAIFESFLAKETPCQRIPNSHDPMDLISGKVDAITSYLTNQPFLYKKLGVPVNIIDPRSYGFDFYGDNLFTTETEIQKNPDRVNKVLRATLKGWRYALENQDEIVDLILKKYNPRLERDMLEYEARMTERMVLPRAIPIGSIDEKRYQTIQQTLFDLGEVDKTVFPEGFVYNDQPSGRIALTEKEQIWIKEHPEISLASPSQNEPMASKGAGGEWEGLLPEFVSLLNERLGTNFKISEANDGYPKALEDNTVRGVFAGSTLLMKSLGLEVSDAFAQMTPVLYTRNELAANTRALTDLAGKTVVHYKNSALLSLGVFKEALSNSRIILAETPLDGLKHVYEGRADAMIGLTYHSLLLKKYFLPGVVPAATLTELSWTAHIGVKKGQPELLSLINKGIAAISNDDMNNAFATVVNQIAPLKNLLLTSVENEWLKLNTVIRVGIDNNFSPIEYRDEDGRPQGVSIDYLRRLEEILGVRLIIGPQPDWTSTVQALKDKQLDLGMAMQKSVERSEYLSFLAPHIELPIAIFGRADADFISDPRQLAGKRVAVVKDYPLERRLRHDLSQAQFVSVETVPQGLRLLAAGEVDAFIDALLVTSNYLSKAGLTTIKIIGDSPYKYELSLAVRKDWPILKSILTKAMAQIPASEREEILRKWFTVKYEHGFDYSLFWKVGAAVLLVFAIFASWSWRLKKEVKRRQQAEDRFRGILEGVKEDYFFFSYSLDGILNYVSPGSENVLGIPAEELIGKTWSVLNYSEKTVAAAMERNQKLLAGEIIEGQLEIEYTHPDGDQRFLISQAHIVHDDSGKPVGYEGIIKDVTQERVAAQKLLEAKEQAERAREQADVANKAKSTFLANMSHELRTPLTAIIGYAHLLKRQKDLPPKALEKAETIDRSSQHLVQMINDVLEVSKIEAGQLEVKAEAFDPQRLFEELKEMFVLQAQQRGLDLQVETNFPPMRIKADLGKLRQVLINLVGNACKFTETGSIHIGCECIPRENDTAELLVRVKDTGPGMSQEELGRLFQPFEQGESGRKKGGTGLGLVISRKYARLLGGDLVADSTQGEGSCFTLTCFVTILQTGPVQKTPSENSEIDYTQLSGKRILLADDDADIRGFVVGLLQQQGVMVFEAEDGEAAVSAALEKHPDMIIMDIRMPKLDGYGAIERLKASEAKDIPIMVATASVLGDDKQKLEQSKADYFIGKPIAVDNFFDKVAEALNIPRIKKVLATEEALETTADLSSISAIPRGLKKQLKEALETLEPEKITEVIAEIEELNQDVGRTLKMMANDFHFNEIGKLL